MIPLKHLQTILVFSLIISRLFASESQLNISMYMDSNPREYVTNPESVNGFKVNGRKTFNRQLNGFSYFGFIHGQGFLELSSLSRTKFIVNANSGIQHRLFRSLRFTAVGETFQKLYINDLSRSGWSGLNLLLDTQNKRPLNQRIGIYLGQAQFDYGSHLEYGSRKLSFNLNRFIGHEFFTEATFSLGYVNYPDYPVKTFKNNLLVLDYGREQQDKIWRLVYHLKYSGRFIGGVSLSYEDVRSNSVVSEATVLIGKLYASGRLGDHLFLHLVLQGMDKSYAYPQVFFLNLYRDPEESIQNQVHLQIERIMKSGVVVFAQYSYLKNETVFDRWYYEKSIIEVGVKRTL